MRYFIDRMEGAYAVCEDEDGAAREVLRALLPPEASEGDLLEERDGVFTVDAAGTAARREKLRRRLQSLWED